MLPHDIKNQHVFISPLDWGLGHATRLVPLIYLLLENDNRITLGGGGPSLQFLRDEFPALPFKYLPSIHVKFPSDKRFTLPCFLFTLPKFFIFITREYFRLQQLMKKEGYTIIISDNRYGLHSNKGYSVLITHQLQPVFPSGTRWLQGLAWTFIRHQTNKFDVCWVPDYPGNKGLSGMLSHVPPGFENISYIGPLSRFQKMISLHQQPFAKTSFVVVILSGPEPQRSAFGKLVDAKLKDANLPVHVLRGRPGRKSVSRVENMTYYDNLPAEEMAGLLVNAGWIIARSGYSTIMDLHILGCKAILIPTPGQPEQEYLAEYLKDKRGFRFLSQEDFKNIMDIKHWLLSIHDHGNETNNNA